MGKARKNKDLPVGFAAWRTTGAVGKTDGEAAMQRMCAEPPIEISGAISL
jgi:hypothetical protein